MTHDALLAIWLVHWITATTIHQIFSLTRDWSEPVAWLYMSKLKLGNAHVIFPNFQIPRVAKKKADQFAFENMLKYFSLDTICSSKVTVFGKLIPCLSADRYFRLLSSRKSRFIQINVNLVSQMLPPFHTISSLWPSYSNRPRWVHHGLKENTALSASFALPCPIQAQQ